MLGNYRCGICGQRGHNRRKHNTSNKNTASNKNVVPTCVGADSQHSSWAEKTPANSQEREVELLMQMYKQRAAETIEEATDGRVRDHSKDEEWRRNLGRQANRIADWVDEARERGKTHVLIVRDGFDYSLYPVFVSPEQDVESMVKRYKQGSMEKVKEVYSTSKNLREQLEAERTWNVEY